ncbi:MAG: hypothetical protein IJ306_07090 [Oscillospiraceae bacterium]|nr:hypothetical protein [Oscillospiraceae bacterium]
MKKILALMLAMIMMLSFAACGSNEPTDENNGEAGNNETVLNTVEGTPEEIIEKIYAEFETLPEFPVMTMNLADMDAESFPYYTGLADNSKVKESAFSEAAMGSQAYSMVIVRVNDAADTEAVANEMLNGIDTRKWICVEADDLAVAAYNDVIMLYMIDSQYGFSSESAVAAFNAVVGGEATVYTR